MIDRRPETLYKKLVQLAGGPGKTGNGFAALRRLFRDNKGSGDVVEYAGIEVLRDYPRCNQSSELSAHLDGSNGLLDNYDSELPQAPRTLRSLLMGPRRETSMLILPLKTSKNMASEQPGQKVVSTTTKQAMTVTLPNSSNMPL